MTRPLDDSLARALSGRYDLQRELGRGGMATVYLAHDVRHDRPVALKVFHADLAAAVGAERFLREVHITARLTHPHILPLLDSGEAAGYLYYVMPLITGETLRQRLDRDGALPIPDAVRITREVADALSYAHEQGVVHRDIKPENILLQGDHAVVADFGIARALDEAASQRLTASGLAIGTPLYMSPEQAHGDTSTQGRSDTYSLACVTWEMLTGEPPYTGPNPAAITARKLTEPVAQLTMRRSTATRAMDAVLRQALAATAADRHPTTRAFAESLASATTAPAAEERPARWRWPAVAAGTLVVVAVTAWALTRESPTPPQGDVSSVAVLPFDNVGGDAEQEYFAAGLSDELVTSLSRVQGVRVAARTSTNALKAQGLPLDQIGERLGVTSLLEGTVRRSRDSVRVTARLVTASNGFQQWSASYQREASDALRIQEEIAGAIVETLRGQLGAEQREVLSSGTDDPEAYDLYLRGRHFRGRRTPEGFRRAVELFQQALARSPKFARAYEGLAESYAVMGFYEMSPPREAFPQARVAAEEALRLSPGLGSVHATLGYIALYHDWDLVKSEREFQAAITKAPDYALAHQWYANHLTVAGRFADAQREMRTAVQLDPLAIIGNAALIWIAYHHDLPAAIAQYAMAAELDSTFALTHVWGGIALGVSGRLAEAERAFRAAVRVSPDGPGSRPGLAWVLALRGDRAGAGEILKEVEALDVVPAYEVAAVYVALGRRREALRFLRQALLARSHSMTLLRHDPRFAGLKGDPEFEQVLEEVRPGSSGDPSR